MDILVIDFNSTYADTLAHVLERNGCRVQAASEKAVAVALLRECRFDIILMGTELGNSAADAILRELHIHVGDRTHFPAVRLMSNTPSSGILAEARSRQDIDIVPARAESILSILRTDRHRDALMVAGVRASTELRRTLLQEGYPLAITGDLPEALRQHFNGIYPAVFLETQFPSLTESHEFAIFRHINARNLACLANAIPESNFRSISKPHRIAEIAALVTELKENLPMPQLRLKTHTARTSA
jgi:CheY-like chemotaxis protein